MRFEVHSLHLTGPVGGGASIGTMATVGGGSLKDLGSSSSIGDSGKSFETKSPRSDR